MSRPPDQCLTLVLRSLRDDFEALFGVVQRAGIAVTDHPIPKRQTSRLRCAVAWGTVRLPAALLAQAIAAGDGGIVFVRGDLMDNRRGAVRLRTLKSGKVVFNDGNSVVDCVVRDLSESGAKLKVVSIVGIPDHFSLALEGERNGRACSIAWRKGSELGVTFDRESSQAEV